MFVRFKHVTFVFDHKRVSLTVESLCEKVQEECVKEGFLVDMSSSSVMLFSHTHHLPLNSH